MIAKEPDGACCHAGALLLGFSLVALSGREDPPKVLVAEPTDGKPWISDSIEEFQVFAGGLERTDAAFAFSLAFCDCSEGRLERLRGSSCGDMVGEAIVDPLAHHGHQGYICHGFTKRQKLLSLILTSTLLPSETPECLQCTG